MPEKKAITKLQVVPTDEGEDIQVEEVEIPEGSSAAAPKVYVAGPMRGYPDFNFPAFIQAAQKLRGLGWEIKCPAEHDLETGFDPTQGSLEGFDIHTAFAWDIEAVLWADFIVMLPGWQKSQGAKLEKQVADMTGTPVLDFLTMDYLREESPAEEAHRLVNGERQNDYGHPWDDFSLTGRLWAPLLGLGHVTPEQVALCMAMVKIGRLIHSPDHRDSVVDVEGYMETYWKVRERRGELHRQLMQSR